MLRVRGPANRKPTPSGAKVLRKPPYSVVAPAGHGVGLLDGAPPPQDVGYRDYGGYPVGTQLTGRPGPELLEMDPFGRPQKRPKFADQRALAAHGQLQ